VKPVSTGKGLQRSAFLHLARPDIGDEEIAEVVETLRSGWLVAGPRVGAFEAALEQRLAPSTVRCLSSATAGLLLGLKLAGVGRGDEVLVPTLTFAACANVVEQLGATPVFVDSEPGTGLLDLDLAERLIGPRTKALMPVHLGGRPVDMDRVNAIRDRTGVAIVEDAAHAIGAEWAGRPVGSHGNLTAFSFHASKVITTIEGGAIALPDPDLAERVESLRVQGLSRSAWSRHGSLAPADYDLDEPGFKLSMTDVAAALGVHQLARLDAIIDRREELARCYDTLLEDLPLEREPEPGQGMRHGRHLYAVRVPEGVDRNSVVEGLAEQQIGTSIHFKPIHRFRYYRESRGLADRDFPVACSYADRTLSLPLHQGMSYADVEDVASALAGALA
jgi:dTDP-4-amino-4,6-dideoxygalactose transaminase